MQQKVDECNVLVESEHGSGSMCTCSEIEITHMQKYVGRVKVAVHPRGPRKHCVISLRTYSTRNPRVRLGTK